MKTTMLLLLVVSGVVAAQPAQINCTPADGGLTYYVNGGDGSDGNACTSTGGGACKTIQGALNKVPRCLLDGVTVNVSSGSYAGFYVSGFLADTSYQTIQGGAQAGILISGERGTSTVASGTASGTATGGTAGNGATTFGTLEDTTQSWTTNDLRGRFVRITGGTGSGQNLVIYENTATTLTVAAGVWTAPTTTTTYVIEEPRTIITTPIRGPGSPFGAGAANAVGIYTGGNNALRVAIRDVRVAVTATVGIELSGGGTTTLQRVQVLDGPTSANVKISDFQPAAGLSISQLYSESSNAISHIQSFDNATKPTASISGVVLVGGAIGLDMGSLTISATGNIGMSGITKMGISSYGMTMWDGIQATRIACASVLGVGAGFGAVFGGVFNSRGHVYGAPTALITSIHFSGCGTGLAVLGPAAVSLNSVDGSVTGVGFNVQNGGFVTYNKAATTLSVTGVDIDLDESGATGSFAGASPCYSTASAARACGR